MIPPCDVVSSPLDNGRPCDLRGCGLSSAGWRSKQGIGTGELVSRIGMTVINANTAQPRSAPVIEVRSQQSSVYNIPGDPPYTVPETDLADAIKCPAGNTSLNTGTLYPLL
jgi:hypothetical protein